MLYAIFAIDRNNLFGNKGKLPWHYSEDLKYFKEKTLNKTIIMGEETFKSVLRNDKPLPNRTSVIATLTDYTFKDVEVTHDIFGYIKQSKEDLYIIGGKSIIELTYRLCDILYITYIDNDHEGDTYLNLDLSNFELVDEKVSGILHFRTYKKIK
ncbi:dihydrofolate reductase [bacterium]|nr:dihydrofolate reductase [bacterium]